MVHTHATTLGLALAMLGIVSTLGFVPVTLAQKEGSDANTSKKVVATVTTIDANTAIATLKTEEGEVFEHPKVGQWHVGHKVLCTRTEASHSQFQDCQLWEPSHRGAGAPQMEPVPRR